jgi:cell division protein ZapA
MTERSKDNSAVCVNIMDKEFLVACPLAARQDLERAARMLDERMREIRKSGKQFGMERIAVMAALNLAYDLLNATGNSQGVQQQVQSLNSKLEQALAQDQQLEL